MRGSRAGPGPGTRVHEGVGTCDREMSAVSDDVLGGTAVGVISPSRECPVAVVDIRLVADATNVF